MSVQDKTASLLPRKDPYSPKTGPLPFEILTLTKVLPQLLLNYASSLLFCSLDISLIVLSFGLNPLVTLLL